VLILTAMTDRPGSRMTRHGQGVLVALAAIMAIALGAGGAMVLADSGHESRASTTTTVTLGSKGPDRIIGSNRADVIHGSGGRDLIRGRGGSDTLRGGTGGDRIGGGKEFDRMVGGRGADRIAARDRRPDEIDCGAGRDVAIVDRHEDGVFDCERLRTPRSFQGR
jgi:Ca2+-binding RTX toxin-like protein